MQIKSLVKTTLIDYPNHIAAIIFVGGCNFRCDYCYNKDLVYNPDKIPTIPEETVLSFLNSRKKVLEGLVITGGEPTLQKDLKEFILKVKALGLKVKLDSNGYNPEILEEFIALGIIDYIAMDIKASLGRYAEIAGVNIATDRIKRSIELLKTSGIPYEFRTTVWKNGFSEKEFQAIYELIQGTSDHYLQNMYPYFSIKPKLTYEPMSKQEIEPIIELGKKYVRNVQLRGEWY